MIVASPQDLPEKTLIVANLQVHVHDKEKDKDSQTERNFHCCCEFQTPKKGRPHSFRGSQSGTGPLFC